MDNKKQGFLILIVLFSAIILYWAIRVLSQNDETRIRRIIYAAALAVEQEDLLKCGFFISDLYLDKHDYHKADVLKLLEGIFKKFRDIKVEMRIKISAKLPEAEAIVAYKCYFKELKKEKNYYDVGKLKIYFKKENSQWKMRSLDYSDAQEILMLQGVA